ncbi:hypothetical protein AB3S75_000310 [Citrus x aurantiifolia]
MASLLINLIFLFSFYPAIAVTGNEIGANVLQTYIVRVQKPEQGTFSTEKDLERWYHSFLPATVSKSSADDHHQSRILYCYKNVMSGFAARLTAEEVKAMETKKGFISAHVETYLGAHTTNSPKFLGLNQNSGLWKDSNLGKGVIIGVIDSGVKPDHPSFSDEGMPPPPAKWKGKCELEGATCNNKVIGVRNFLSSIGEPAVDDMGHGTHTASTAAGNFVSGANTFGLANGTAVGMAPLAHLAIYKTGDGKHQEGFQSRIAAAIEAAIQDGVDVISISYGSPPLAFYDDPIASAAFTAVRNGIFVSCAAGNKGPDPSSSTNGAPWILTVGASTTDRSIVASAQLGNHATYDVEILFMLVNFTSVQLPLVYPGGRNSSAAFCLPGSLNNIDVKGKVVVCERDGNMSRNETEYYVKEAGGAAMILISDKFDAYSAVLETHVLPAVQVGYATGDSIKAYINSTSSPTVAILLRTGNKKSAPEVASLSARGPNKVSPGILKPDIIGPGVSILAAWPSSQENITKTKATFEIADGTSMSCPHLSGIAALLKSTHPDWSPAAIKSAIMTTADIVNLEGKPIINNYNLLPADLFAVGAGHVNPSKANDPGLIYDIQADDYVPYLCGLNYTDQQVQTIVDHDVQCSKVPSIAEAELNYPSFSIKLGSSPQTYNRTITNVGEANSSYTHQIVAPEGVEISVQPNEISFTERNQKVTYSITFTRSQKTSASYAQGYLSWVSTQHTVRSPIAVSFE